MFSKHSNSLMFFLFLFSRTIFRDFSLSKLIECFLRQSSEASRCNVTYVVKRWV